VQNDGRGFLGCQWCPADVDFFLIIETATEECYCKMLAKQKEVVEKKRLGW
jgi:hypothetical protein